MAQPTWVTAAGSLGVIPEGIYYQQDLLASTPVLTNTPTVTASSSSTNRFTCSSTSGIYAGLNVTFVGTPFGGVNTYTRYFVFEVYNSTEFSISTTEFATSPIALSTDSGSNYNVTKTTTFFEAYHFESDSETGLPYQSTLDLAQSTGFQPLSENGVSNENDASLNGSLTLFNPSSTTYVKHFIATTNNQKNAETGLSTNIYVAGYGNTTSAINAVRFQMSSGNIDDGKIYLYGIK